MRIDEIVKKYMGESDAVVGELERKIDQVKKKLKKQPMRENFGQREVREIKDSFDIYRYSPQVRRQLADMIRQFANWCADYTGLKESVAAVEAFKKKVEGMKRKMEGKPASKDFGEKEVMILSKSIRPEDFTKEEHKKVLKMVDEFEDWCISKGR